jgi:APA family basic amino acid/polyamine antiporter
VETESAEFSTYSIAATLVWISLSFSGFNSAVYVAGEVEDPKHNVPRALLLGTTIVTLLYLALNFIFVFGDDPGRVRGTLDVAAVAAQAIGGDWLAILIRVIVSVSLLSSVSSMLIAGPRVYTKMASDGVFPKLFASSRRKQLEVPAAAIWLQVILASVVYYVSTIKSLLDYLGFTLSVSAALTVACIFWTRRPGDSAASRRVVSAIAMIYVAATIGLATLSVIGRPQQLVGFAATVGSGILLYRAFKRNFSSSTDACTR